VLALTFVKAFPAYVGRTKTFSEPSTTSIMSVMGDTPNTAATRGVKLDPNLVAEVTTCVVSSDDASAASMAAVTDSANNGEDDLAAMMLNTLAGREDNAGVSADTMRTEMGPSCNLEAAVIADRVAGGKVVDDGGRGSETTKVEASRDLVTVKARLVAARPTENMFLYVPFFQKETV
jgi:hypothetical protein